MTQQKYIYAARLQYQKNRASAALIVFVVVLSDCILLSIDKMDTLDSYDTFLLRIRKTISDEKAVHCSAEFKKWVIKFKILHQYLEWELKVKAPFQMKIDTFQDIIYKKQKETTNFFISLETLAVGMAKTHDYENQKSCCMLLVQKNNQEVVFCEMSIYDYQKAYKREFLKLGKSQIVGTALKEANVIFDKIREYEKEIDELEK